jgi:type 1 glutamine amidotransferase
MRNLYVVLLLIFLVPCCNQKQMNFNDKNLLKVLVFSKTIGYRHESTPDALNVMKELAGQNDWMMKLTEDSAIFSTDSLEQFDVIVFLLTGGEILDDNGKEALKEFIHSGGGLVTIHTGCFTMQEWPWFNHLIGAGFIGHPPVQQGKLIIEDNTHTSTDFTDDTVIYWTEEWYSFDRNPRSNVHVLMSVDENSYDVDDNRWFQDVRQRMGDHPVAWYHENEGGRVFQTALGHEAYAYHHEFMQKHIVGAISWAGHR